MRPINIISTQLPAKVEQVRHWLELLNQEYVILVDSNTEVYTFLLPLKDCPDIHIALENLGNDFMHMSFFSNGLTSLSSSLNDKQIAHFLRKVVQIQGKYFTTRVITTGEQEILRVFLGSRFSEMNMYRFTRKIRDLIEFVQEIAQLINDYKLNEIWRDTEQEPKIPEIDMKDRVSFL